MKFNFMLEEQVHSKQGMRMPITWQTPGGEGTLPSNSKPAALGLCQGAARAGLLRNGGARDSGGTCDSPRWGKRTSQSQGPSSRREAYRESYLQRASKAHAGDRARNGVERGAGAADTELGDTELYREEAAVIHLTPSSVEAPQLSGQIHNFDWHWLFCSTNRKN